MTRVNTQYPRQKCYKNQQRLVIRRESNIIQARQTFDLGCGFWKNAELVRHGQLSLKQWSDLNKMSGQTPG